jgi:hypothetical protein
VSLLDDIVIEIQIGIDLIRSRQSHILAIKTVKDGNCESIREYAVIEMKTRPSSSFVEGLEVFGIIEQLEKSLHLVTVFLVVWRVDGITTKHALPIQIQEFLDDRLWKMKKKYKIEIYTEIDIRKTRYKEIRKYIIFRD